MFTGLVTDVGRLASLVRGGGGARVRVEHRLPGEPPVPGESVAVDGVCLTVARPGRGWFEADLSPETLSRSTLGKVTAGRRVNLERALAVGDRFGGHLVQGHVDGLGTWEGAERSGDGWEARVRVPATLERFLVEKGSVAVDGISLTVARLEGPRFAVALVPHTWEATNLPDRHPGDPVNLEMDLVVRTVVATLERLGRQGGDHGGLLRELRRGGWLDGESPVE